MSKTNKISSMSKRSYRNTKLMSPLIEAWLKTTIPKRTYCKSLGIKLSTFNYWLERYVPISEDLAVDTIASQASCLVPLEVELPSSLSAPTPSYELVYPNGVHLRLPSSIDLDSLHTLLLST